MGKKRKLRKQEEVRNIILDAAREIIAKDGIRGLSIRKLTNAIDYSPAIVYHYFKSKDDIVDTLVREGYGRILSSIDSMERNEDEPEKEIREAFARYIESALEAPEYYKAVMLDDGPTVLRRTRLLEKGASEGSPTLQMLCDSIRRGVSKGRFAPCDIELTAQILWTSVFGLVLKLMVEKDIPREQANRLIDHQFNVLFNGIMARNGA